MSNVCSAVTLELPKSNRFWSGEMQKFADCAACAMGLETSQGPPIGKVFCIACSDQVLATGLAKRFQCKCTQDHAPLNQVNYSMTERYSYKFASICQILLSCHCTSLDWSTGRNIVILFVVDCSLHQFACHVSSLTSGKYSFFFSWTVQWNLHVCMVHSGFRDIRLSGTVFSEDFTKWILKFCHQESGDDISIVVRSLSTPLWECSHQEAHTPVVLFCCVCVFSFSCSPGRPRRVRQQWVSFLWWCYFLHWLEWWLDLWGQLLYSGFVEHWNVRQLLRKWVQSWRMRQFRLNILRLHQMKRQTSDKCRELRLRFHIICTLEQLRRVITSIAVVVAIQIGTMRREDLQFVKSAVFHLRLLRLGKGYLFLNKDRSSIWPDIVGLSRVYRSLNIPGAVHVVQWNIRHRFYSGIRYLAEEGLLPRLLRLQVYRKTRFFIALRALRIGLTSHRKGVWKSYLV